jgi:small subunit ribosomal protein S16
MPAKIRLARHGRKKGPFYHIVVADSRAPRDGRFIEKIGVYNPKTNPATIELDFNKSLDWLQKGAQPTDTCRAILSYKGVMYKKHLLDGVKKNAFSLEEAEIKFTQWQNDKDARVKAKADSLTRSKDELAKQRFEQETKVKEAREKALAKKRQAEAAKEVSASVEETADEAEVEETADEAEVEETNADEAQTEETTE